MFVMGDECDACFCIITMNSKRFNQTKRSHRKHHEAWGGGGGGVTAGHGHNINKHGDTRALAHSPARAMHAPPIPTRAACLVRRVNEH